MRSWNKCPKCGKFNIKTYEVKRRVVVTMRKCIDCGYSELEGERNEPNNL